MLHCCWNKALYAVLFTLPAVQARCRQLEWMLLSQLQLRSDVTALCPSWTHQAKPLRLTLLRSPAVLARCEQAA